ncbi:YeiH family protein [Streptococcus sanguinis]|uniref:YeiH family protein n=1 Tax=Streptococcus sanguinis TaxID=1305 RepID=UPI001CC129B8|nr:YeiH family protein [Streptococcus sanguinis]MBZ2037154.1 YeiH family protein [Streptococcus sanguinis]MBZ2068175.1 YeiH family protein [Streptococcus sanguinis]MBZ2069702.1 YeiH family protein [Streptococcus sanguinis]
MFVKKYLPGILLSFGIAAVSIFLGGLLPLIGSSVLAIVFGIVLNNSMKLPAVFQEGLSYSGKKLLQYSIIFLGFSMSIGQVSETGISSLRISLITILIAFLAAYLAGRFFKMNRVLTILIGFGTAICGGSAIAAASPILDADEEEIALSISTIFFFNILAVFIFPFLGHLLQMSDAFFGTWAGTAINDTSSVVAAGYTYSSSAGDLATIVKLSRALMIVPACLLFAAYRYIKSKQSAQKTNLKQIFPWFIAWFVLASLISSLGFLPAAVIPYTKFISQWLMAMALAAIGAKVSFKQFKQAGAAPLLTGAFAWFCVAVSSLIIQYFF